MSNLNPLIGPFPCDTLNNASYVLLYLTTSKTLEGCALDEKDDIGLCMILDTVRLALEYESDRTDLRLNPKEEVAS